MVNHVGLCSVYCNGNLVFDTRQFQIDAYLLRDTPESMDT